MWAALLSSLSVLNMLVVRNADVWARTGSSDERDEWSALKLMNRNPSSGTSCHLTLSIKRASKAIIPGKIHI